MFLTFSVILVTLVFQGLTPPPLIRWLGLAEDSPDPKCEEQEARRLVLQAALAHLEETGKAIHRVLSRHLRIWHGIIGIAWPVPAAMAARATRRTPRITSYTSNFRVRL